MKKPIFADIAELVGGLIKAEKKKKKRRSAPSKYDVIGVQKLVKALPARPARLPVVLVPGARRGRPPGSKNKKKIESPETAEDLALEANDELEEARALLDKAVVDLSAAEASAASSSDADRKRVLAKIRSARTAVTVKTKKFEKAAAKAEAANESVARLEEGASPASDELLDYLDRPDFFETLPKSKMSPALKKLQERIVAKRAPPASPSAFTEAKKRVDATRAKTRAETRALAEEAATRAAAAAPASPSAFTEAKKRVDATRAAKRAAKGPEVAPLIGVGRFLGRFE